MGAVTDASIDDADPDLAGEGSQVGADLLGELPGGGEHECAGTTGLGAAHGRYEGNPEGEGLAGAGRGSAADVATGEGVGDGDSLDGERRGNSLCAERIADRRGHAEIGEGWG